MRHLLFFLIFSSTALQAQKVHFEGEIKFTISYFSQDNRTNIDKFKSVMGDSYTCYIKPGFYRQEYNTTKGLSYVIYDYKTNRYYYKYTGIDTLFFKDCSIEKAEIKFRKSDTVVSVLNYKCNSIELSRWNYKAQYFYASDLYVDPAFYQHHKMGGYDVLTSNTESIYLKLISDFGMVKTICQATSVVRRKIDDKVFEIPNLPLKEK